MEEIDKKYYVYWIQSGNRAYIGASVDLKKRLRQHNSEIVGGSCRTCGRGPWRYVVAIEGFRTWHEALCFEWRFQYDTKKCRSVESRKNAHIFFRKLTVTSSLGCRQVIWSIRLARLSFLETNSLLVSLLLLPATYNLSNEQSRFSQPGCSSYRAN